MVKNLEMNAMFEKAIELMEETDRNVFITGRAGTGKSTLLEYFRSITEKNIVVLAPTGVAAVNIGGQTIHSFFRFRPNITVEKVKQEAKDKADPIYKNLDAIVIDEVSMVRADLLDCMDAFLRINGREKELPFGGIQMIFIGDLYQIPPVVVGSERQIFKEFYDSEYFFDAKVFQQLDVEYLELEKIYRQTDAQFINLLNKIRNKTITEEDIELLNQRVVDDDYQLPDDVIYLTTTNAMAEEKNEIELSKLPGKPQIFEADIIGDVDEKSFPADRILRLKKEAQVMLLNNDPEGRWVNGTIASVDSIEKNSLEVILPDGSVEEVKPVEWDVYHFSWDSEARAIVSDTVGSFMQYPVKLAWAITIHKSQGKTFDNVMIDLGKGTFTSGQLYVALSRCRRLDGIFLKRRVKTRDVLVDWRVMNFVTQYQYEISEKNMPLEEKIMAIEKAIEDNRSLEITYLKSKDEKTRRVVQPHIVSKMEYNGKHFMGMKAYCQERGNDRTFRVDRILEMRII